MRVLQAFPGPLLLLEEDHAVTPDALSVLHAGTALLATECPECLFFTLGMFVSIIRHTLVYAKLCAAVIAPGILLCNGQGPIGRAPALHG